METLISYLSDFMNGWTLVDVVLITIGFALAIKYYKKSSNYFLDIIGIGKKIADLNDRVTTQAATITSKIFEISQLQDELLSTKEELYKAKKTLSKCIDRPRVNGKFVKKQHPKESLIWKCKTDAYGENILKGNNYKLSEEKHGKMPNITKTTLTLIGEKGTPVLVDRCNFEAVL